MKRRHTLLGVVISISLIFFIESQAKEKSPPLVLKHADELQTNWDEENMLTNLYGNVWFEHGDWSLKSQRAVWYKSAGQVVLTGGVEGQGSTRTLKAERVVYYQKSGKAVARGE